MPENDSSFVTIFPSDLAAQQKEGPFVAIIQTRAELYRWLQDPAPGLEWLQIQGMLADAEAWTEAAHDHSGLPLDVVLSNPSSEFSDLYRLVDVCSAHDVRITIPAVPGLFKAGKLATALHLPIRILPGQPGGAVLLELNDLLELYLHEPSIETPVEFFHSVLSFLCGADSGSLWTILEQDPAEFRYYDADGRSGLPGSGSLVSGGNQAPDFVKKHLETLIDDAAECASCPWQVPCGGYFKWPDPTYSCGGVKQLFSKIEGAADEIGQYLASQTGSKSGAAIELRRSK
ncbi:MAG: hypothetical protein JO076_16700 [Verrucomicrobia bacterium]|nr:hypothetical protein [Verrucomicrobiota bacterium]